MCSLSEGAKVSDGGDLPQSQLVTGTLEVSEDVITLPTLLPGKLLLGEKSNFGYVAKFRQGASTCIFPRHVAYHGHDLYSQGAEVQRGRKTDLFLIHRNIKR